MEPERESKGRTALRKSSVLVLIASISALVAIYCTESSRTWEVGKCHPNFYKSPRLVGRSRTASSWLYDMGENIQREIIGLAQRPGLRLNGPAFMCLDD